MVLISHPSLTGIKTETGLSGSTQWHNAVRARFYLKGIRSQNGQQEPTGNLREIINYEEPIWSTFYKHDPGVSQWIVLIERRRNR